MAITSPANGATVGGSVPIRTADTCAGNWFETVYVDGRYVTDADTGAAVFNSRRLGNGSHVIKITSQSINPGSQVLGSAQVTLNVLNAPSPSPSPSPNPGSGCVTITSPANGATVRGSVPIRTTDKCAGNWFETLYVDGRYVTDTDTGAVVFNSLKAATGNHVIRVTSQSMNPGSRVLGSAQVTLNVQNGVLTPSKSRALSISASASLSAGSAPLKVASKPAARGSRTGSVPTLGSTARSAATSPTTSTEPPTASPTTWNSTSGGGANSQERGGGGDRNTYVMLVLGTACMLLSTLGFALFVGWRRSRLP